MLRRSLPLMACGLLSLVIFPLSAPAADPVAGEYSGINISLELAPNGDGYAGSLHFGNQVFPMKAKANAGQLSGTFTSDGHDFSFTATVTGDALALTTENTVYQLTRKTAAPVNPLAGGLQEAAAAPGSINAPAGFSTAVATDSGKAWVTKKSGITSVAAALQATLHDLATFAGNQPVVKGAFEDTKDHQSGGASFTATIDGKAVVGLVTCKLVDKEAKISVTYCLATATAADWAKLNATAVTTKPPAPAVKLTTVQFPDGTGSVGIAEGWTLKSGSAVDPLYVTGSGDQNLGSPGLWWIPVEMPDSPRIRQEEDAQKRLADSARRLGRQPAPPPPSRFPVVAPFTDPEHALPVVNPQWNAVKEAEHIPVANLVKILSAKTIDPAQPGWKTQILEYTMTRNVKGEEKLYRARATWSSMAPGPAIPSAWALTALGNMVAPDATFDKDVITMEAMSKSIRINWDEYTKVDWERFEARMKANGEAFDARVKAQRQQQIENMKAYAQHNEEVAIAENQKSRNAADWIEYAGGYRTVIDTQTGQRGGVDLSNVNNIVDALNNTGNDPNRFVQIPLRDERAPLLQR